MPLIAVVGSFGQKNFGRNRGRPVLKETRAIGDFLPFFDDR
jgi:hypothetical protein